MEHYVNLAGEVKTSVSLRPVDTPFLVETTLTNHIKDPYAPDAINISLADSHSESDSRPGQQSGTQSGTDFESDGSSKSSCISKASEKSASRAYPVGKKKPKGKAKLIPSEGGHLTDYCCQCAHESAIYGTFCKRRAAHGSMSPSTAGHKMDRRLRSDATQNHLLSELPP